MHTCMYTDHVVMCPNESDVHTSRKGHPGENQLLDPGQPAFSIKDQTISTGWGKSGVRIVRMETSAITGK